MARYIINKLLTSVIYIFITIYNITDKKLLFCLIISFNANLWVLMDKIIFADNKIINRLPKYILIRLYSWVTAMETIGWSQVKKVKKYNDTALKGQQNGQRVAYFGKLYRVIYEARKSGQINHIVILKVERSS